MIKSRGKTRFYIYAIALLPFVLLMGTGLVMLNYHTGAPYDSTVIGLDGHFWLSSHKLLSAITIPLILLHLFVKTDWVKKLFTFKLNGRFKKSNIILFVVFTLCMITSILSWLVFNASDVATSLRGIHNKLGLVLIIMFCIHIWNYRKQIISQFRIYLKQRK